MNTAEIIKTARERAGLTQEDLAEKLEVSRQAVSKWELGASLPSPENLQRLVEVLDVEFPAGQEEEQPPAKNRWKPAALLFGGLFLLSILSLALVLSLTGGGGQPREASITGLYFFDEDGAPFNPNDGANWYLFEPGSRVILGVDLEDGADEEVYAVSMFLTPTGTETFEERKQVALRSREGEPFVLFALDIPDDLMGHLEIRLECSGGRIVTEELNVGLLLS